MCGNSDSVIVILSCYLWVVIKSIYQTKPRLSLSLSLSLYVTGFFALHPLMFIRNASNRPHDRTVSPRRSNINYNCHENVSTYFAQNVECELMQFSRHVAVDKMTRSSDNVTAVFALSDKYYLLKNVSWSNPKIHWLFAFILKRSHCWKNSVSQVFAYIYVQFVCQKAMRE
jgi:hypothetical protein